MIKDVLSETEERMNKTVDALRDDLVTIRTGRASPALVERLPVEYYGTPTALNQLATISVPEPRLLAIRPWDPSALPDIEKAILKSELGLTPSNDGKIIRLVVPALSTERREELIKIVKKIAEEGRVSIRTVRKEANEKAKDLEKAKKISEDNRFRTQDEIQKLTDKYIKQIDKVLIDKERELREF